MTDDAAPDSQALERRLALYDRATRLARLGAWECDLATEQLTWSPAVYELFELSADTTLRRADIVALYPEESRRDMEAARAEAIGRGQPGSLDVRIRTSRGAYRWMHLTIDAIREGDRPIRLFGTKQDVTALKEAFARLREMAERDCLTGLPNRRMFDACYRDVVVDKIDNGRVAALALIDLDRFKAINDTFGHLVGDECLRQVALRLHRAFPQAVLLSRIGGDEFAVLLPTTMGPAAIRQLLRRAAIVLDRPIRCGGQSIAVGVSIGATLLGRPHVRRRSELFAEADAALYAAKAAGRNVVRVFGDDERPWRHAGHAAACEVA